MHQVGEVYKASTHLQTCKRADGHKIINQLVAQLSSLKYVNAVVCTCVYQKCVVHLIRSICMQSTTYSSVLLGSRLLSLLGVELTFSLCLILL